jgi:hypothetical protein
MTNDEYKDSPFPPNVDAIREFLFVFRIRIGSLERKTGSSSSSSSSREVGGGAGPGRATHGCDRSFFLFFLFCGLFGGKRKIGKIRARETDRKKGRRKKRMKSVFRDLNDFKENEGGGGSD